MGKDGQFEDPTIWAMEVDAQFRRVASAFDDAISEGGHLANGYCDIAELLNGFLWLIEKKILILSPAHSRDRGWVPVWEFTQGAYQFAGRPEPTMADESVNWGHNLEFFKAVADQLGYVFVKVEDMPDGTSAL